MMSGRSRPLELESDLVLNQRLLQAVDGVMTETLDVAKDIDQYCKDDENLKMATQDIMLSFINMEDDIKQYAKALNYVKNARSSSQAGASGGTESGAVENLTATFTQKLEELRASNKNDDSRHLRHRKYQELTTLFADRGNIEEEMESLRMALVGKESDSQGDLIMTEVDINTRCPYTGRTMQDPVRNTLCGHIYDREGIIAYIRTKKSKAKCPVGGCGNVEAITESQLVEERTMKRYITLLSQTQGDINS